MPTDALPETVAIVIVTYNRSRFLDELLSSAATMQPAAWRVIVVDNASDDDTAEVLARRAPDFPPGVLVAHRLETNTGGSGGFSEGVRLALELDAEWIWLMDDDVEIIPDALARLAPWARRFDVVHGRRYDVDGSPFYWQARFNEFLGVPLPYTIDEFRRRDYAITNSGTFEGMLIRAELVHRIGLPDPRFFISWDDALYAWLAAQVGLVSYVNEYVLRRKRPQKQVNLGFRHFNDGSALFRYHVMRNRAYVGRYFAAHGRLNRFGFALGTALTFGKEVFRLLVVQHTVRGYGDLTRGLRDGRRIWRDADWRPMPPLASGASGASSPDATGLAVSPT